MTLTNQPFNNLWPQFFASRDQATAEAFGRLLDKTGKRENKIDEITDKLRDELGMLSDFLDNIASRRPEGMIKTFIDFLL